MSAPAKILLAAATDWPFPARLAGAFTALDARVEAVCLGKSPMRRSACVSRLHRFSPLKPLTSLARAITAAAPELVIPCDDLMAGLLWRLEQVQPELQPLLSRAVIDGFPLLSSRNDFLREAAMAGVAIADTIAVESADDLTRALAVFGLPLVVKADGCWGGDGVAIARDEAAARAAFQRFSGGSRLKDIARALKAGQWHLLARARFALAPRLGAQRFITGRPATSSIACWRGKVLAANHFDVLVSNGTGPATVLEISHDPAMAEAARRIAARFNLSGLYGLDYMRGEDGATLLLEINPRATPTAHLALGPDHDLAAALLTAAGHPIPDRPAVTRQERIALFPQEWRRDATSPHLSAAFHDLPHADSALAAALGWRSPALTSFSPAIPGLSGFQDAAKDPGR